MQTEFITNKERLRTPGLSTHLSLGTDSLISVNKPLSVKYKTICSIWLNNLATVAKQLGNLRLLHQMHPSKCPLSHLGHT